MTIFTNAFLELVPKALGMGGLALLIAVVSKRTNVQIAKAERARLDRMFAGSRRPASSTRGEPR